MLCLNWSKKNSIPPQSKKTLGSIFPMGFELLHQKIFLLNEKKNEVLSVFLASTTFSLNTSGSPGNYHDRISPPDHFIILSKLLFGFLSCNLSLLVSYLPLPSTFLSYLLLSLLVFQALPAEAVVCFLGICYYFRHPWKCSFKYMIFRWLHTDTQSTVLFRTNLLGC